MHGQLPKWPPITPNLLWMRGPIDQPAAGNKFWVNELNKKMMQDPNSMYILNSLHWCIRGIEIVWIMSVSELFGGDEKEEIWWSKKHLRTRNDVLRNNMCSGRGKLLSNAKHSFDKIKINFFQGRKTNISLIKIEVLEMLCSTCTAHT